MKPQQPHGRLLPFPPAFNVWNSPRKIFDDIIGKQVYFRMHRLFNGIRRYKSRVDGRSFEGLDLYRKRNST